MRPDLADTECWIFDLDNTLYPPSVNLFRQISAKMTGYIVETVGISANEATELRDRYWQEYGATVTGLVRHHGVAAEAFLTDSHQIDYSGLSHDPHLAGAIEALPGRCVIHTNAPRCHAEAVIDALGYSELFDRVFALEDADLVSKPHEDAFHTIYARGGIDPSRSAMIEDDARNLAVPHAQSVRTIWLDHARDGPAPEHVRHRITDLTEFLMQSSGRRA